MCKFSSFIVTRSGKIHHGFGITDSHTTIKEWAGLGANDDTTNAYEWQAPKEWPNVNWEDGLTKDLIVFEEKKSHLDAMGRYLKKRFPTMESFKKGNIPFGVMPTTVSGYLDVSGCDLKGVTLPNCKIYR